MFRRRNRKPHGGPTPQQYVVTQFPAAVTTPTPTGTFSGNGTNNNILATDTTLTAANAVPGTPNNTLFVGNFGWDSVLPTDAAISKVEIIVRDKFDGASAHPRPGVITRVSGTLSGTSWHEQGDGQISTTLADFTHDVTADPASSTWSNTVWKRSMLLDGVFAVGVRSRNTDAVSSVISWDSLKVRITYVGAPPGSPVSPNYTLTVGTSGDGTGVVTGPGIDTGASDTSESFPKGTQVKLVATANSGSLFGAWLNDATGTNPTTTIAMNSDKIATARFDGQPPGDELSIHTGTVLNEDFVTVANPIPKWFQVNDPYHYGGQSGVGVGDVPQNYVPADDNYIFRQSSGGDTHIPIGQSSTSVGWRRHVSDPNVQSIFDHDVPNSSTRSQLIINSRTTTFHLSQQGDHNWTIFSHRRHGQSVLPVNFNPAKPFLNASSIMVCQWKTFKDGGGQDPILSLNEWKNGYQLTYNDKLGGNRQSIGFIPCADNVWTRFRFECLWTTNPANARFALWGDTDGVSEKLLFGPKLNLRTLYPNTAGPVADFSVGPYCNLGTSSGIYNSDFANIQVCAYV